MEPDQRKEIRQDPGVKKAYTKMLLAEARLYDHNGLMHETRCRRCREYFEENLRKKVHNGFPVDPGCPKGSDLLDEYDRAKAAHRAAWAVAKKRLGI